jgi:hypothetical protein
MFNAPFYCKLALRALVGAPVLTDIMLDVYHPHWNRTFWTERNSGTYQLVTDPGQVPFLPRNFHSSRSSLSVARRSAFSFECLMRYSN